MPEERPTSNNKLSLSLDMRLIIIVLLVIIVGMLVAWKPWAAKGSERTLSVKGETTVKAEPDEYVFNPYYSIKKATKQAALDEATKKSNTVVAGVKKLGVEDKDIKTNTDGYSSYTRKTFTYSLRVTVTVNNKDLAQKVQDYLVGTAPEGSVTPYVQFSDAKRKELESQARNQATKDAREKADQLAENLGAKVSKVKEVKDDDGFGNVRPYYQLQGGATALSESSRDSLTLQPGQNDLRYSVTVVYFVR